MTTCHVHKSRPASYGCGRGWRPLPGNEASVHARLSGHNVLPSHTTAVRLMHGATKRQRSAASSAVSPVNMGDPRGSWEPPDSPLLDVDDIAGA